MKRVKDATKCFESSGITTTVEEGNWIAFNVAKTVGNIKKGKFKEGCPKWNGKWTTRGGKRERSYRELYSNATGGG